MAHTPDFTLLVSPPPPSHIVQSKLLSPSGSVVSATPSSDIINDQNEEVSITDGYVESRELLVRFQARFGSNLTPKAALAFISALSSPAQFNGEDFWLCFDAAYPDKDLVADRAVLLTALDSLCSNIDNVPSRTGNDLLQWDSSQFRVTWYPYLLQQDGPGFGIWKKFSATMHEYVPEIRASWMTLRPKLSIHTPENRVIHDLVKRLDSVIDHLSGRLERIVQQEQVSEVATAAINIPTDTFPSSDHSSQLGILKTPSWSSAIEKGWGPNAPRNRSANPHQRNSSDEKREVYRNSSPAKVSIYRRIFTSFYNFPSHILEWMGSASGITVIVSLLALSGAATTGVAAWECPTPDLLPTVDSNFWSTVSSAAISIAGVFCTIIPYLLNQSIDTSHPTLFKSLLILSVASALAAVSSYPWQTRTSLICNSVSGLAQLATTLQLVQGAVKKIVEARRRIDNQEGEIRKKIRLIEVQESAIEDLGERLEALEGRLAG